MKDQPQPAVLIQMRSQRKETALERTHLTGTFGWGGAPDEKHLSSPGIREIVVIGIFGRPFQPIFFFCKDFVFPRKKVNSHIKIGTVQIRAIPSTGTASCPAEAAAIGINRGNPVQQPVNGQISFSCNHAFHTVQYTGKKLWCQNDSGTSNPS